MKREPIQQIPGWKKRGINRQQNSLLILWDRAQISRKVKSKVFGSYRKFSQCQKPSETVNWEIRKKNESSLKECKHFPFAGEKEHLWLSSKGNCQNKQRGEKTHL